MTELRFGFQGASIARRWPGGNGGDFTDLCLDVADGRSALLLSMHVSVDDLAQLKPFQGAETRPTPISIGRVPSENRSLRALAIRFDRTKEARLHSC